MGAKMVDNCEFNEEMLRVHTRLNEYRYMTNLAERYTNFQKYVKEERAKKQERKLNRMQEFQFKSAQYVNQIEEKNNRTMIDMFRFSRELQREFVCKPIDKAVTALTLKINALRRRRDILQYQINTLCKKYSDKLMELAEVEDNVNHIKPRAQAEKNKIQQIRSHLRESQTRISTLQCLSSTYKTVINVMTKESLSYELSIQKLEKDMKETNAFIEETIEIGSPAFNQLDTLKTNYETTVNRIQDEIKLITTRFLYYKDKLKEKKDELDALLARDAIIVSKNKVGYAQYIPYTNSMIKMSRRLDTLEHTVTWMQSFRVCPKDHQKGKKRALETRTGEELLEIINKKLNYNNYLSEICKRAHFTIEDLRKDDHDAFKEHVDDMMALENKIEEQIKERSNIEKYIQMRKDIFVYLRYAIFQMADQLRNVGESLCKPCKNYPNANLKLPLLDFSTRQQKTPPLCFEEDSIKALAAIKYRIRLLLTIFLKFIDKGETMLEVAKNDHETAILEHNRRFRKPFGSVVREVIGLFEKTDLELGVPTRRDIKAISEKIWLENQKED